MTITGRTQRGSLLQATTAIQRILADAAVTPGLRRPPRPPLQPTGTPAAAATGAAPATAESIDEVAATERRLAPRFSGSSFTAATGTRGYKLFEPAGFDGQALPLVVMLHGCTQDPDDFAAGTRMNVLAQARGCFVLYPAQGPRSNASKCWNWFVPGDQRRGRGEPALIAALVRHVVETHAVDPDRVYVAGLSAGGAMAAILAREYGDVFAAAGVHSGLPPGAAHDVASAFAAMKSGAAVTIAPAATAARPAAPVIVFQGEADATVHPSNGTRVVEFALGGAAAAPLSSTTLPSVAGRRGYTRQVFGPGGTAPSRAESWRIEGAGHAWSGGDGAGTYTDPKGPDASAEMLRFFLEHPRRRDG